MKYFTQAVEEDMVKGISENPDACVTLPERESYRPDGQVVVFRRGRSIFLHRLLYQRVIGRLSRGEFLLANCDTTGCVNPFHRIKTVTPRGRNQATHCPRGHAYSDDVRDRRGRRYCIECRRLRTGFTGSGSPTSQLLGEVNRQKRFCPQGHEYSDANTYLWVDGKGSIHRSCKTCKKLNRSPRKASS